MHSSSSEIGDAAAMVVAVFGSGLAAQAARTSAARQTIDERVMAR
jgi:hypothetical protein